MAQFAVRPIAPFPQHNDALQPLSSPESKDSDGRISGVWKNSSGEDHPNDDHVAKISEKEFSIIRGETLNSGDEAEHEEISEKVSFTVGKFWFNIKNPSLLNAKGFDVTSETVFVEISIKDDDCQYPELLKLTHIPISLVQEALQNVDKTAKAIDWQGSKFRFHFEPNATMNEDAITLGFPIKPREIKSEKDVVHYETTAYMESVH